MYIHIYKYIYIHIFDNAHLPVALKHVWFQPDLSFVPAAGPCRARMLASCPLSAPPLPGPTLWGEAISASLAPPSACRKFSEVLWHQGGEQLPVSSPVVAAYSYPHVAGFGGVLGGGLSGARGGALRLASAC